MNQGAVAAGAVVCGVIAATLIPGGPPGAGIPVVALLVATAVLGARPSPLSSHAVVCLAFALAFVSLFALRAAGWLLAWDLLAAISLASSAAAGGVTWSGVTRGGLAVWATLTRGLSFVTSPLRTALRELPGERSRPVLRGLLIGGLLVATFGILFASADRAFLELAGDALVPDVEASLLPVRIFLALFVPALVGAFVLIGRRSRRADDRGEDPFDRPIAPPPEDPGIGFPEWSISLGLLNLLFGVFVAIQLTVLFGGRYHVLDTTGLTYAQYARQGFFQLVVVALLTFAIVGGAAHWARAVTRGQNVLLRLLLGLLCILTLVILASALRRLVLYEETYGFTRLRISVHATILWFAVLFGLVLVALAIWRGSWLPRAFVYVSAAGLLAFSLVNPDAVIAGQNVERYEETGEIDIGYLQTLSADAVGEFEFLRPEIRECIYSAMAPHLDPETPWQHFNLARSRAVDELAVAEQAGIPCDSSVAAGR